MKKVSPTEYAGLRNSSAYSLIVICVSKLYIFFQITTYTLQYVVKY